MDLVYGKLVLFREAGRYTVSPHGDKSPVLFYEVRSKRTVPQRQFQVDGKKKRQISVNNLIIVSIETDPINITMTIIITT